MAPLPTIHLLHASNALQHLEKLKKILQSLKTENRIYGFVPLMSDKNLFSLNPIEGEDMVILFLTRERHRKKG